MRGRYPEHAKNRRVREKGLELRIPQSVQMDGLVLEGKGTSKAALRKLVFSSLAFFAERGGSHFF